MDTQYKPKEQLCISYLSIHNISFDNTHHFEMRKRKVHNDFGFITNGSAEFVTMTERVFAKAGDLIFIPEGIRYVSHWSGDPLIHFYSLKFLMPKASVNLWRNMKLQRVDGAPNEQIHALIEQMCAGATGDDASHLESISCFYQMLSLVLPHLQITPIESLPVPLQTAIAYIEANYATIGSVREIAAACFLSESRLYHLFQEHLNISPISYLNRMRIHAAIELLPNLDLSIQQISEQLNFHSEYHFRKTFQKVTGELPSKLRKML